MGRGFKEVAHLRTDKEKFDEGWDRIFGKKEQKEIDMDTLHEKAEATAREYHEEKQQEASVNLMASMAKERADHVKALFAKYGITSQWLDEKYAQYSGDDDHDVSPACERMGWEFIAEAILTKLAARKVSPVDGGCWFCHTETPGMMFDTEFDTYVHRDCLLQKYGEGDEEAQIMGYLLNVPEREAQDE